MASNAVTIRDYRKEVGGKIDPDDSTMYVFPEIVSESASKKQTFYRIVVRLVEMKDEKESNFLSIKDEYFDSNKLLPNNVYGYIKILSKIGTEGKIKDSPPTYVRKGKNINKSNETNVFTQALRDAISKYNKHKQKQKVVGGPVAPEGQNKKLELYPPMLAQVNKDVKPVDYSKPVYMQRKYNGVRVVATYDAEAKEVILYSRKRKLYPGFNHIKAELKPVLEYYLEEHKKLLYIDGEIYKHGVDLQLISGIARKSGNAEEIKLDYCVYDVFIPAEPTLIYSQRKEILDNIFSQYNMTYCLKSETFKITSEAQAKSYYEQFLKEGYEGAMIRLDVPYRYSYSDYHSTNLLKIKPVLDREDKIIGFTAGTKGKAEGALMFILELAPGKTITINLGMKLDERKRLYKKMTEKEENGKTHFENNYLGKMINYKYDEMSTDGIPVRARTDGIVIRDYE